MPPRPPRRAALSLVVAVAAGLLGAAPDRETARADTVVFTDGKKREGVVVSRNDDTIVVNPYNSRCPDMTWGITEKHRFPRDRVKEVRIEDPPAVEWRRRTVRPGLGASERRELAEFCDARKLKDEAERERRLARAAEAQAAADEGFDGPPPAGAEGDPELDPVLRRLEREYLRLTDPAELAAQWDRMTARRTTRSRLVLERARRSAALPVGRREKVPLTLRAKEAAGATYCIHVPAKYDPLTPTPLVVGLHGGGPGGKDGKLVTGSGESAMNFYQDLAEEWGFVVVCPTALAAGWGSKENEPLIDGVLDEMRTLYHVDESRIYLTGHSMGGFGTWEWGPRRADVWAAIAPCAGGGGPNGVDPSVLPVYVYHGADDAVVGPSSDRSAADHFAGAKKRGDFVYTELDGVGHGFPEWVRRDIFAWFAGRTRDGKRKDAAPVSSFARKVEKAEVLAFGDPSAAPAAADAGAAKLADLVARLERGGGASAEAADELGRRRDAATAKAVAKVLRSKKANADVRVAAARALGGIATPEALDALGAETSNEDFRIVDEVVTSLGRIGGPATVAPLERAARTLGGFFDASKMGDDMVFTEFEVRTQSFGRLADALAATGDAAVVTSLLEREVVARVFTPKTMYRIPVDERFVQIPPRARLELAVKVRAALEKAGSPRTAEILAAIRKAWANEGPLVAALS